MAFIPPKLRTLLLVPVLAVALVSGAAADYVQETIWYASSISQDHEGPLDLVAELNYDEDVSDAPIAVVMHSYSCSTTCLSSVHGNAAYLRDRGFFAISVAMRGRDGSDGIRDSGGLEIYDIYDAVEHVKDHYEERVDPGNVHITGYSGGGGNSMSALTKFPDYFTLGSSFVGIADYGYEPLDSWYFDGADYRTQTLDQDIGDPTLGDSDTLDRYLARASNLASRNNSYSEIHLFANPDETICPPWNHGSYLDNAVADEDYPGEFDNVNLHIGSPGLYHDFDEDGVVDWGEEQTWPHSNALVYQAAGEGWYIDRLAAGELLPPELNDADELFVAGWVKTARFELFLGDGQNAAADLSYAFDDDLVRFEMTIASENLDVTGELEIETEFIEDEYVVVSLNGVAIEMMEASDRYLHSGLGDGDVLELDVPCPGADYMLDTDGDGVADCLDACPLDAADDSDGDRVCDSDDVCSGADDRPDTDGDGTPDCLDACPADFNDDSDGDGACDSTDLCTGDDTTGDTDGDGVCDGSDACPLDAADDSDGDGACDSDDLCPGADDRLDTDGDGTADCLDPCPDDVNDDSDSDGSCDSDDICPGTDDFLDTDADSTVDCQDACPADNPDDSDLDGVCDSDDQCPGAPDVDTDGDGVLDCNDPCPADVNDDSDGDGSCDSTDLCTGDDTTGDTDGDGVCDGSDACPLDAADDSDGDGACDSDDICSGADDRLDTDGDGVPDACDLTPVPEASPMLLHWTALVLMMGLAVRRRM